MSLSQYIFHLSSDDQLVYSHNLVVKIVVKM